MTSKNDDKTKELISFFVNACEGDLGRTRLMKLLYLADYEARRYLGRPLSSLTYVWHYYGPFDRKVESLVDALKQENAVEETKVEYPGGKIGFSYRAGANPVVGGFHPTELAILSYVCTAYSKVNLRALLDDIVYETEPMLEAKANDAKGAPLNMKAVDNAKANDLGTPFVELFQRSLDVKAGKFLSHAAAMTMLGATPASHAA